MIRPEVVAFAEAMEAKLNLNDHKEHWNKQSMSYLVQRLREEMLELRDKLNTPIKDLEPGEILSEAADVANFAMMIADKASELQY